MLWGGGGSTAPVRSTVLHVARIGWDSALGMWPVRRVPSMREQSGASLERALSHAALVMYSVTYQLLCVPLSALLLW